MGKFVDLTGQRFGMLIVIERAERPKNVKNFGGVFWLCGCDCGNIKIIRSTSLISGRTKSCGCQVKKFIDLTGKKFGRLNVIKLYEKKTYKYLKSERIAIYWLCKCDCGTEKIIEGGNLKSNTTMSCGCYNKEIISKDYKEASINRLFRTYNHSAKKRKLSFELSKNFFIKITQQNCFYCEKEPSNIIKSESNNGDYTYNGIDRIDSSKGYTEDNVVPCCGRCNEAKMAETQSDFYSWIDRVYHNLKQKGEI